MKVNVEIEAKQIYEGKVEIEKNKCEGEINYLKKGTILEFTEKYAEGELQFKMTILDEKIITKRNGKDMIFDLKNKHNTTLDTPYGTLGMTIDTKKIQIQKHEDKIEKINLEYEIDLENSMKYMNEVNITLK